MNLKRRSLTPTRLRRAVIGRGTRLGRRGVRVTRRILSAPAHRQELLHQLRLRTDRNRDFVAKVTHRSEQPDYWRGFAEALGDGWYGNDRAALLVRFGIRSWRSLPGVETGAALEIGHQALQDGDLEWAELIAAATLAGSPTHQRANQLMALIHAARGEWRPAQDCWRISLGGNRFRLRARRWAINERGRDRARRLVALMPEPGVTTDAHGLSLTEVATIRTDRPSEFDDALGSVLINQATHGNTSSLRPLVQSWATSQQRERILLAPIEVAQSVRSMNVERFRTYVTGRSIALVANSPSLVGTGLGSTIDGYDLVLRFNSFSLSPVDNGGRTDIHVAFHKYDFNLDVPVDVRILLSAKEPLWRESLKLRIRPGAQQWLGDNSLRWPAVQLGLVTPGDPYKMPTAGFNMIRLLLHLGVSERIDLFGFDFYESGMHRLAAASTIPHARGHNSAAEKEWVMEHAVQADRYTITMDDGTSR